MKTQLLHGDCLERLKELPDNSVDAVVTDPPYGINRDRGMGGGGWDSTGKYPRKPREYAGGWDADAPSKELLERLLETAPLAVVWGGNYLPLPRGKKMASLEQGTGDAVLLRR